MLWFSGWDGACGTSSVCANLMCIHASWPVASCFMSSDV